MNKNRKALLILGLISLIFAAAGCQEADQASTTDGIDTQSVQSTPPVENTAAKTPKPKIIKTSVVTTPVKGDGSSLKFENLVHDFGVMGPNASKNCEFKFTNIGKGTLKFPRKPKADCGCTIPKLDKMEYAAGESGVIKVRFTSKGNPAIVRKHITVFSNDPENPNLQLTIRAKVELAITFTPKIINLRLDEENGGMKPIVITSKDGKEFAIKTFTSTGNIFTPDIDVNKKATTHTITPKVDLKKLKNRLNGNIYITVDHPGTREVLLRYITPPPYKVSTPMIFLGNPDPDKPEVRDIIVLSNYGKKVEIESIVSSKKCIEIISKERKGNSIKLVVKVTPKRQGTFSRFRDTLVIKFKDGETISINAHGTFRKTTAAKGK